LRGALGWERRANLRQPTKHVRTHTHNLKPLNHFTVVPQPLSSLRFNMIELINIRGLRVPPPLTSLATLQCIMGN